MKRLYIIASTLSAVLMFACEVSAQNSWIDITDDFVVNPRFDGNDITTGWLGTAFGAANPKENAEHYQRNFNTYQVITGMTPGKYRVSVNAFYRCGSSDNDYSTYTGGNAAEYQYAKLYATSAVDDQSVGIVLASSAAIQENLGGAVSAVGGRNQLFIPNNMEAAYYWFNAGYYQNSVEVEVGSDGQLTIGVKKDVIIGSDWTCLDNWKLEYWGIRTLVSEITLADQEIEIQLGEARKLTPNIQPSNATKKKLSWSSSDTGIVTIDEQGNILGVGRGKATITATSTDGSNASASCTVVVEENIPTAESLVINEIMASNVDEFVSPAFQFDGWIELYNPSDKGVTLAGLWLSNDPANAKMWKMTPANGVLPAKGYKVIWFENSDLCPSNANIKLDVDGGQITISDDNGTLIASASYPASLERISYARTTDGGEQWGNTDKPTPGKSNSTSTFGSAQLSAPMVSEGSQVFTSTMNITVDIPSGTKLRYTTDGTLPTETNGNSSKTGVFTISNTTNFRFRLFADGMMASPVTTRSYIKWDKDFKIPVLSVVSDPRFLYDDSLGVYVRGVNGKPGNGQSSPCNWNMDWERPVNMSYINEQGEMVFNQDVNLEMCGGWSRAWEPHSFKLKGEKELGGNKNLSYPFFEAKPYIRNRTLQVRNGGNDNGCRFKDAALETIIQTSGVDIDLQSYQPVHEFLNGKYIGVLNVREPNNKHYVYANYGWDNEVIDQFEMSPDSGYVQKEGTIDNFMKWYDLSADAANNDTYEEIKLMVDIDEYTNYMAAMMYLGGTDWPQNNIKGFRLTEGGKFRFVSFDLDFAFSTSDPFNTFEWKNNYTFNELYNGLPQITAEIRFVTLFLNMLKNNDFRKKFIDTYCIMGGSVFEPTRCNEILDSLVNKVAPEMAFKGESPYSTYNSVKDALSNRQLTMTNALKKYWRMQISDKTAVSGKLCSDTKGARLELNGIDIPTGRFDGQLFAPMTITAVAPAGYRFAGWKDSQQDMTTIVERGSKWTYYDKGSLDNTSWTSRSYSTSTWKQGNAPLGYGKDNLSTTIAYGGNSSDKYPTYYFRQTFNLSAKPATSTKAVLNFTVDDGFIVYINGKEAGRYNMPSGTVDFNTFSTTYAPGNPDTGTMEISTEAMVKGNNVIAVEVHNNNKTSSDIYWDAELKGLFDTGVNSDYVYTEPSITMPDGGFDLVACYQPMDNPISEGYTPIRINEISAANDIYVNEYGKKNDWVELYNTTDEPIDVEGMFLSNDANKPNLCMLSKGDTNASTIIPAKGYMVVWCDKLATAQDLHTTFKLSATGGTVTITAADGSWTDSITYPAHDEYSTIGRYADGSQRIYHLTTPTIGKANIMTSYAEMLEEQISGIRNTTVSTSNSITLRLAAGNFIVRSDAESAKIEVYTLGGQKVAETAVDITGGIGTSAAPALPHGCYIAKATDSNGKTATMKIGK